jgi:NAD(P)-dependent dehydrogenase (short-subunit alcohol dehydrogenase family)
MGLLDGKVAVITGASKGIGRVMSGRFAAEGAKVVCSARTAAAVEQAAAEITRSGGRAVAVAADASTEDGARHLMEAAVKAFGRLDVLVNNAGDGGPTKPVQDYTVEDWFYTVNSCLTSSYLCVRFAVPHMITGGGGSIINISSMAGRRGLAYRIGYCASKAGQVGMAFGLAVELGSHNIRVNVVAPGAVEGDRIDSVIEGQARVRGLTPDAVRTAMIERSPLRRFVNADDISSAALFLASDLSRSISGQVIPVNAGDPAG